MSTKKFKIMIADDHEMFRDGIKLVLSQLPDYEIIAEASNGSDIMELIDAYQPDLVLMDVAMPGMDGITATKEAVKKYPDLKIIGLSMYSEGQYYREMIEAGARGFVLKKAGKTELETAIKNVLEGNNYISQELLVKIIKNINHKDNPTINLTAREKEVLLEICNGLSNKEIAVKLDISPKTVDIHRTNLLKKTKTRNTASLIMYSLKNQLVTV